MERIGLLGYVKGDCAVRASSLKTAAKDPAKCFSEQELLKYQVSGDI